MPTRNDWVTFEGVRATKRGVAMLLAARADFERNTGRKAPRISQGGRSGSVGASAGTHLREAFDFATAGFSANHCREWEKSLGRVGFAGWWRRFLWNVWPQHHHAVPKGGDLSRGAQSQERSYRNGRDGLARNLLYAAIRAYRNMTWEAYRKAHPDVPKGYVRVGSKVQKALSSLSVATTNRGRANGHAYRETLYIQRWLRSAGFYKGPLDARWGRVTQAAFDGFRRSLGWPAKDCTGPVGITSLTLLAKAGKSTKSITQ